MKILKAFILFVVFAFFAADGLSTKFLGILFNSSSGVDSVFGNSAYVFYLGLFVALFFITLVVSIISFSHKDWGNMKFSLFILLSQTLGISFAALF
jgi:hypothetical protein